MWSRIGHFLRGLGRRQPDRQASNSPLPDSRAEPEPAAPESLSLGDAFAREIYRRVRPRAAGRRPIHHARNVAVSSALLVRPRPPLVRQDVPVFELPLAAPLPAAGPGSDVADLAPESEQQTFFEQTTGDPAWDTLWKLRGTRRSPAPAAADSIPSSPEPAAGPPSGTGISSGPPIQRAPAGPSSLPGTLSPLRSAAATDARPSAAPAAGDRYPVAPADLGPGSTPQTGAHLPAVRTGSHPEAAPAADTPSAAAGGSHPAAEPAPHVSSEPAPSTGDRPATEPAAEPLPFVTPAGSLPRAMPAAAVEPAGGRSDVEPTAGAPLSAAAAEPRPGAIPAAHIQPDSIPSTQDRPAAGPAAGVPLSAAVTEPRPGATPAVGADAGSVPGTGDHSDVAPTAGDRLPARPADAPTSAIPAAHVPSAAVSATGSGRDAEPATDIGFSAAPAGTRPDVVPVAQVYSEPVSPARSLSDTAATADERPLSLPPTRLTSAPVAGTEFHTRSPIPEAVSAPGEQVIQTKPEPPRSAEPGAPAAQAAVEPVPPAQEHEFMDSPPRLDLGREIAARLRRVDAGPAAAPRPLLPPMPWPRPAVQRAAAARPDEPSGLVIKEDESTTAPGIVQHTGVQHTSAQHTGVQHAIDSREALRQALQPRLVPHVVQAAPAEGAPTAEASAGESDAAGSQETPGEQEPGENVDLLARQVYRILRRRLLVERERDLGRW